MPQWKLALLSVFSRVLVSVLTVAVGFRLERVRDGVPVGQVVVRIDGRWVEPQSR
jgi:hypothetical protein